MKIFKTKLLGLALVGLILGACSQLAMYDDADLMNEQVMERDGFNLNPFGIAGGENAMMGGDCKTDCIDEDSGDSFAATYTNTVSWGGPNSNNNTKTLSVKVWNTLTTIEYEFTITGSGNAYNPGKLQYFDENLGEEGEWVDHGILQTDVPYRVSRPLEESWKACNVVTEQWRQEGGGSPVSLGDVSYSLIGACGCEDEMTAKLTCGEENTVTFTFFAEEAGPIVIQGGLNANASITDASSNVLTRNLDHRSVKNGATASVTRWEGDVEACEEVTVTVSWTGPADIGDWTAKRGDDTLGEVLSDAVTCEDED